MGTKCIGTPSAEEQLQPGTYTLDPRDVTQALQVSISQRREHCCADKVVPEVGLVVTLYDLLKIGPGQLFPSDPAAHFQADFRLVVFCPFPDEVLTATLIKADPCALQLPSAPPRELQPA